MDRYQIVRRFVPQLCEVVTFDATADAKAVLDAFRQLPELMMTRPSKRFPAGWLDVSHIDTNIIGVGWWKALAFRKDRPPGSADRIAYTFCVLEQFHQRLRRRDIFATRSTRWADPRAQLLTGTA